MIFMHSVAGMTLLGGALISELTGITTVADFRMPPNYP